MTQYSNNVLLSNFQKYCGRHKWTESGEQILQLTSALKNVTQTLHDGILKLPSTNTNFKDIVLPSAYGDINFMDTSSYIEFFQYVSSDKAQRKASTESDKDLTDFVVKLSMSKEMFDKIVQCQKANPDLEGEEKRLLDRWVLDGKRRGLHLDKPTRNSIEGLIKEIQTLCITFSNNINNENTILHFDDSELVGVSMDLLESLEVDENGKRKVTLKYPHVVPIMKYCQVESTRKSINFHFNSRCINQNTELLEKIVSLRHKKARLLGYNTHAQYTIEKLMAKTPETVDKFLDSLVHKLRPLQKNEIERLIEIKKQDCSARGIPFDGKINSWDYSFYTNLVSKIDYRVDHDLIKEYFDFNKVSEKIYQLYQDLLQLKFIKVEGAPTWHSDVALYAVIEDSPSNSNRGQILGYFYLDLFPRPSKYSHAACFTIQHRCMLPSGEYQPGVSAMVANFTKPLPNKPCLFTHSEVETFFHEFGHVMHTMCSSSRFAMFSGTSVERDFVEAPSQMLENWVWDRSILKNLAIHHKTHQPMADDLIDRLIESKKANAALYYLRQISFSKLDQSIHSKDHIDSCKEVEDALTNYWGIKPMEGTNFSASFGHLAGGYDARYYGYLWSQVYSADMYSSHFKTNPTDSSAGLLYRKCILSPGGSQDGMDMLVNFLGRKPSEDAFIKQIGLP